MNIPPPPLPPRFLSSPLFPTPPPFLHENVLPLADIPYMNLAGEDLKPDRNATVIAFCWLNSADPDPAFNFNADPDPAFHFYPPDSDPAFHFNADPDPAFHLNADPDKALILMRILIELSTVMRIQTQIQRLFKVMGISDHWSKDPPGLHFEPPGLNCERPRFSTSLFLASKSF